ncbi:MAG: methyltransferase domain-containing protein [Bacteroidales bacterium]|nr:methyltransferase domain-containing protein [Bacteroidales bacterium]
MNNKICNTDIPFKHLFRGIVSFLPFANQIYGKIKGDSSHSCSNPRFCYSLWLRILVTLNNNKLDYRLDNIAEIGNSSSIGVGLVALLTGVKSYSALEVVKYQLSQKSLNMCEELIKLFRNREDIPDDNEFSNINIQLDSYKFPTRILTEKKLSVLLSENRLNQIRKAILNYEKNSIINYYVPWEYSLNNIRGSFDLVFSRAVMEHIADYPETYRKLKTCLKPRGFMLHDIEYHNHGIGTHWNSHWCYSNLLWELIKGKRSFIINRSTHSMHLDILKNLGFQLLSDQRKINKSSINRNCLAKRFKSILDIDMNSYGGWILAIKK